MDTKLKNISRCTSMKVTAFTLIVLLLTASVLLIQYAIFLEINPETLIIREYRKSSTFNLRVDRAIYQTLSLMEGNKDPDQIEDIHYYITDGDKTFTNVPNGEVDFFKEEEYFAFENGQWSVGENTSYRIPEVYYPVEPDYTMYISFPEEYMAEKQWEWQADRDRLVPIAGAAIFCLAIGLLLTIYLILVAGRKPGEAGLHLSKLDRIYSDILLGALIIILFFWLVFLDYSQIRGLVSGELNTAQIYYMIFIGIVTAAAATLGGLILLSMVRKIKAGRLIKHSVIYRILFAIYDLAKSLFDGRMFEKYPLTRSLHNRQWIFIIVSVTLVFFTFLFLMVPPLFLLPILLELVVVYWYIKYNNRTYEEINKGFNESLEEQMRAERMKVALITNVSHDLKTPLTSIISYIDLLAKEEDLSETARDYVNILSEKSNRLKHIVSDLFDLAKSTSGNIQLDLETLDMKKLIEQTLGDMEDEIQRSGLQIRTKLPEKPVNILSDGSKLYRVFQNIIDNALKYSLEGTRVYVELEELDGQAIATIKNTSSYEMDFTEEEILQRFNRGDQSRCTDGSGLGLSIAQSFTQVTGGSFRVKVDGDLFKVIISYPTTGGDYHPI